jgi:gluconokinase
VPSWAQLVADALGLPVAVSSEGETTSRGVALLALRSLGVIGSLADRPVTITPAYFPDPKRHAQQGEAIERQRALYGRVIG